MGKWGLYLCMCMGSSRKQYEFLDWSWWRPPGPPGYISVEFCSAIMYPLLIRLKKKEIRWANSYSYSFGIGIERRCVVVVVVISFFVFCGLVYHSVDLN
jgi:hypothetical protein